MVSSGGGTFKEVDVSNYSHNGCGRWLGTKMIDLNCVPSVSTMSYSFYLYKNGEKIKSFNNITGNYNIEILRVAKNSNNFDDVYQLKYISEGLQTISFTVSTETLFEKSTSGLICNGGYDNYYSTIKTKTKLSPPISLDGYYSQIINGNYSQYSVIYEVLNGLIIDKSYCSSNLLECNGSESSGIPDTTIIKGTNYNRIWSSKNLEVDHYINGDPIPLVTSATDWAKLTTGAYCYYNNDPSNRNTYGYLYNWYAVNDKRGLAPTGWKIPTDSDWSMLKNTLGVTAGGKLKETGTTHWLSPNSGATNDTGFTALPGGFRNVAWTYKGFNYGQNAFTNLNRIGYWWSSNGNDVGPFGPHGGIIEISYDSLSLTVRQVSSNDGWNKKAGLSIRLIRD
jgi:uncharacterized protein (TIGR02145 family)